MCLISGKGDMSNISIYGYQKTKKRHGFVYSTKAESYKPKNSMILPIPANVDSINLLDGTIVKPLIDYGNEVCPKPVNRGIGLSLKSIRVEKVGRFTTSYIPYNQLDSFLIDRNIDITFAMVNFLKTKYQDFSFTFSEWEGNDPLEAQPLHFEFDSIFPNHLYYPMMEGHEYVPRQGEVMREYLLMMSTIESKGLFTHELAFGKDNSFDAFRLDGMIANGDSYIHIQKDMIASLDSDDTFTAFTKVPEKVIYL